MNIGRIRVVRFDERSNRTRRQGVRVGWVRWAQTAPPYHYEWRWLQAHAMRWDRTRELPALKLQLEAKTYRTAGQRSLDGSKRYLRVQFCWPVGSVARSESAGGTPVTAERSSPESGAARDALSGSTEIPPEDLDWDNAEVHGHPLETEDPSNEE